MNEEFEGVPYRTQVTGAPILEGCIAWYDCRLNTSYYGGDHTVFVGHIEAIGLEDTSRRPLIYYANRYTRLERR